MAAPPYPLPARSAAALFAVLLLPLRIVGDAAWRVALPGGLSSGQVLGGALVVGAAVAGATGLRSASRGTWVLYLAVVAALGVGAVRAASPADAVTNGLHLLGPFAVWAAGRAAGDPALAVWWRRAAWVPIVASAAALAAGQWGEVVLNGWPRLLGFYGNVHTHAASMAVFAAAAALAWAGERRREDLAVGVFAALFLATTLVRGPVVFLVVAAVVGAGSSRAVRGAVALAAALLVALAANRWSDVVAVATWTPPAGGWGALGSHRLHIWSDSVAAFLRGPLDDLLLGRGLGGQLGLHRHLDPHHEALSLWFQLGPLGPVLWGAAAVGAARAARGPWAPAARGLLAGTVALAFLGNDVLYRPTLIWWVAGFAGLCAGVTPEGVEAPSAPSGPGRPSATAAGAPPEA
jgi:hypothetical protein